MTNLTTKLNNIPTNPGCYIYKNRLGQIIYVGKAKNLKKRVASYFQKKDHDFKTQNLVKEIADVEFLITDSEVEALLLESRLIRENKPKYNIDLKDSIRYAHLKITDEKFPRLLTVRQTKGKGKFFGPYADGSARARVALMATKLFKIRTCKKLPKQACLQYHIGNCYAPCEGLINQEEYNKNIKAAELLLKGDTKKLTKELHQRMNQSSDKEEYERAKIFHDQIDALNILEERQKVDLLKKSNQDVINFIITDKNIYSLQIFHIKKGTILNREEFQFEIGKSPLERGFRGVLNHDNKNILTNFIKQYYSTHDIPHEIILPYQLEEQDLIQKYLQKINSRVGAQNFEPKIIIPQKGIKKELLEMVKNNLILSLEPENQPLADLQDKLNLATLPRVIECFDISNIGSTNMVGSMVYFKDGKPDKNNYRKFKIQSKNTQDDFAAMGEIVERRYSGLMKSEFPSREGLGVCNVGKQSKNPPLNPLPRGDFSPPMFPDLIVVDGGLGQLHSAQERLEKLNLKIPIIGLAKKEEEIYMLGNSRSLRLSKKSASLKLLQKIRDEAHRFAISFHRQRRRKSVKK